MSSAITASGLVGGPDTNAVAIGLADGDASLCFQSLPGDAWSGWGPLAQAPVKFRSTAITGTGSGDVMAAVAVGVDGALYYADSPAGTEWSTSWSPLGQPIHSLDGGCAITLDTSGTTVAAAVGTDHRLWSISCPPNGSWSAWACTDAPPGLALTGPCALAALPSGDLAAVAIASDGQLHTMFPALGGTWACIGRPDTSVLQGPVSLTVDASRQLTAFVVGADGNGYTAPLVVEGAVFTSLGHPTSVGLDIAALSAGLLAAPDGRLAVLAPAVDGLAYYLDTHVGGWTPLATPSANLPLRCVSGVGAECYSVSIATPAAASPTAGRPRLRRGAVVPSDTVSLTVDDETAFLVAAVQDAEGQSIPGIGLTVTRPDGTTVDSASPPNSDTAVVQLNAAGQVTSMLITGPPAGTWTATVVGAQDGDDDFQVTLTTLPVDDVQQTIATTLQQMCDDAPAAASATWSWACAACRFGAYAGALLIAGAIAYGATLLTAESAVVLWLATFAGITAEQAFAFIGRLAKKTIATVPTIVTAICQSTGSCSPS